MQCGKLFMPLSLMSGNFFFVITAIKCVIYVLIRFSLNEIIHVLQRSMFSRLESLLAVHLIFTSLRRFSVGLFKTLPSLLLRRKTLVKLKDCLCAKFSQTIVVKKWNYPLYLCESTQWSLKKTLARLRMLRMLLWALTFTISTCLLFCCTEE